MISLDPQAKNVGFSVQVAQMSQLTSCEGKLVQPGFQLQLLASETKGGEVTPVTAVAICSAGAMATLLALM